MRARPLSLAVAKRLFAPKQRNWLTVFTTMCEFPTFEPAEDCPNSFQIDLIDPALIETSYEDGIKVKRLLGDFWIVMGAAVAEPCLESTAELIFREVLMRLALKRYEIAAGAPQELIWNPMLGDDVQTDPTQANDGDFSEARFIREWQHLFHNTQVQGYTIPGTQLMAKYYFGDNCDGDAGDPHCLNGPSIASGSGGGIGVGPTFTTGLPFQLQSSIMCGDPTIACEDGFRAPCDVHVSIQDTWHIHFDLKFRRGIELKENQGLGFYGGWESLVPAGSQRLQQPSISVKGGLRALIET